jgi:hypothetical protein
VFKKYVDAVEWRRGVFARSLLTAAESSFPFSLLLSLSSVLVVAGSYASVILALTTATGGSSAARAALWLSSGDNGAGAG